MLLQGFPLCSFGQVANPALQRRVHLQAIALALSKTCQEMSKIESLARIFKFHVQQALSWMVTQACHLSFFYDQLRARNRLEKIEPRFKASNPKIVVNQASQAQSLLFQKSRWKIHPSVRTNLKPRHGTFRK